MLLHKRYKLLMKVHFAVIYRTKLEILSFATIIPSLLTPHSPAYTTHIVYLHVHVTVCGVIFTDYINRIPSHTYRCTSTLCSLCMLWPSNNHISHMLYKITRALIYQYQQWTNADKTRLEFTVSL